MRQEILDKARAGQALSDREVAILLALDDEGALEELFETARTVTRAGFQDSVFLYGFVYFSNHCRNGCTFCSCRRTSDAVRYRKGREEIVQLSSHMYDDGVHLVDLTMGEDPFFLRDDGAALVDMVSSVRAVSDRGIMVSPGVVPETVLASLRSAGADWYALYQETHNRDLYQRLRPDQSYDMRMLAKRLARQRGLLVEEGIIVGTGDTLADRVSSLRSMGELGARQVRAMSYVPPTGLSSGCLDELKTIAVMRLLYPDRLIPASLDVQGLDGLPDRLNAGANVVTSIIPPERGMEGVANPRLGVDEGRRSVAAVSEVLDDLGLRSATPAAYRSYLEGWRSCS